MDDSELIAVPHGHEDESPTYLLAESPDFDSFQAASHRPSYRASSFSPHPDNVQDSAITSDSAGFIRLIDLRDQSFRLFRLFLNPKDSSSSPLPVTKLQPTHMPILNARIIPRSNSRIIFTHAHTNIAWFCKLPTQPYMSPHPASPDWTRLASEMGSVAEPIRVAYETKHRITCLEISPDGMLAAVGDSNGTLYVWSLSLADTLLEKVITYRNAPINSISFLPATSHSIAHRNPHDTLIAVAGADQHIRVINVATGSQVHDFMTDASPISVLSPLPSSLQLLCAGTESGTLYGFSTTSGQMQFMVDLKDKLAPIVSVFACRLPVTAKTLNSEVGIVVCTSKGHIRVFSLNSRGKHLETVADDFLDLDLLVCAPRQGQSEIMESSSLSSPYSSNLVMFCRSSALYLWELEELLGAPSPLSLPFESPKPSPAPSSHDIAASSPFRLLAPRTPQPSQPSISQNQPSSNREESSLSWQVFHSPKEPQQQPQQIKVQEGEDEGEEEEQPPMPRSIPQPHPHRISSHRQPKIIVADPRKPARNPMPVSTSAAALSVHLSAQQFQQSKKEKHAHFAVEHEPIHSESSVTRPTKASLSRAATASSAPSNVVPLPASSSSAPPINASSASFAKPTAASSVRLSESLKQIERLNLQHEAEDEHSSDHSVYSSSLSSVHSKPSIKSFPPRTIVTKEIKVEAVPKASQSEEVEQQQEREQELVPEFGSKSHPLGQPQVFSSSVFQKQLSSSSERQQHSARQQQPVWLPEAERQQVATRAVNYGLHDRRYEPSMIVPVDEEVQFAAKRTVPKQVSSQYLAAQAAKPDIFSFHSSSMDSRVGPSFSLRDSEMRTTPTPLPPHSLRAFASSLSINYAACRMTPSPR